MSYASTIVRCYEAFGLIIRYAETYTSSYIVEFSTLQNVEFIGLLIFWSDRARIKTSIFEMLSRLFNGSSHPYAPDFMLFSLLYVIERASYLYYHYCVQHTHWSGATIFGNHYRFEQPERADDDVVMRSRLET